MDISRAKEWPNYDHTTTLKDGLKQTWEWFLENSEEYKSKVNYFTNTNGSDNWNNRNGGSHLADFLLANTDWKYMVYLDGGVHLTI